MSASTRLRSTRLTAATLMAILLGVGIASMVRAENVVNDLTPNDVGVTYEDLTVNVGTPGTVSFTVNPGGSDGQAGCNFDSGEELIITFLVDPGSGDENKVTIDTNPAPGNQGETDLTLTACSTPYTIQVFGSATTLAPVEVDLTCQKVVGVPNQDIGRCVNGDTANYNNTTSGIFNLYPGRFQVTVDPPLNADLGITKTDSPDPVVAGEQVTYTIVVTNHGPAAVTGATLTDTFSGQLSDVSWTSSVTGGTSGNTAAGTGNINETLDLPVDATVTYIVTATVNPGATGELSNTATISSETDEPDPNVFPNSATATTVIESDADLGITKSDSPDPVFPGGLLTYTITFESFGPSDAANVTVTDTVPAGTTFVSAEVTSGGMGWVTSQTPPAGGTGDVVFTDASVSPGETATFEVVVRVDADAVGTVSNTATVSAETGDGDQTNDSATAVTSILLRAGLNITKTASADVVAVGNELTYTISVLNAGPQDADNVLVTDVLPAGVELVETDGCEEDPGGVPECNLGTILVGETATFTVTVIAPDTIGPITNTASVDSDTTDPEPRDDSASVTVDVVDPELVVEKIGPDVAPPGSTVVYAITVTNVGESTAHDVMLTDDLFGGTIVGFDAPSGVTCSGESCELGDIEPGGWVTLWVTTTAPETDGTTGMLNTACATTATPENETANNCASAGTTIVGDVPIPPVPVVGPNLYQPEPTGTPTATPTEEPTATPAATGTPEPTGTTPPTEEPTATDTAEPTGTSEPTAPATATPTPDSGAGPGEATPSPTSTMAAPMPPDTGSGGLAGGGGATLWLAALGMAAIALGGLALQHRRVKSHR